MSSSRAEGLIVWDVKDISLWAAQSPIQALPVAFTPEFHSFHATYEITSLWNRSFIRVHCRRYKFWVVTESFPAQHKVNI